MSVEYTIDPEDIRFKYVNPNDDIVEDFSVEYALAHLIINNIVFLNNHWWNESWSDDMKKLTSLNVNCSDCFAWASSDAEPLMFHEIRDLYEHFEKDPKYGSYVWCIKKRNQLPQKPVYDFIQKSGIWNLDEMNLNINEN